GYDEQMDFAANAAGIVGDDWPADLGLDPNLLADPAYHLLHCAQRRLTRKRPEEAISDLRAAMSLLAQLGDSTGLGPDALVTAALGAGTMQPYHKLKAIEVINRLAASSIWRRS